jgi:hypothetical protein
MGDKVINDITDALVQSQSGLHKFKLPQLLLRYTKVFVMQSLTGFLFRS